jgi:hypothetical protein
VGDHAGRPGAALLASLSFFSFLVSFLEDFPLLVVRSFLYPSLILPLSFLYPSLILPLSFLNPSFILPLSFLYPSFLYPSLILPLSFLYPSFLVPFTYQMLARVQQYQMLCSLGHRHFMCASMRRNRSLRAGPGTSSVRWDRGHLRSDGTARGRGQHPP